MLLSLKRKHAHIIKQQLDRDPVIKPVGEDDLPSILVCLLVALVHQILYYVLMSPFSYVFALEEYEQPT
jgi:hypothetical protein